MWYHRHFILSGLEAIYLDEYNKWNTRTTFQIELRCFLEYLEVHTSVHFSSLYTFLILLFMNDLSLKLKILNSCYSQMIQKSITSRNNIIDLQNALYHFYDWCNKNYHYDYYDKFISMTCSRPKTIIPNILGFRSS